MITARRVLLCALAVCLAARAGSRAQERPTPPTSGRVLILQNQHVLEGEIERAGDQYHIRRAAGEMWVPVENALYLCASWDAAFALMSRQANLHDPDERLRLARWCDYNGLHAQALAEATAAVKLRPNHSGAKLLLARLRNSPVAAPGAPANAPPAPADDPVPAVDLSSESLAMFTGRVQPILMNACASCHATGRGGKFKLVRCTDPTLNRRGLHQNLGAVLALVDFEEPATSKLLYKAVSGHGGTAQAPLLERLADGEVSVPVQTLRDWVELVVARNPHLRKLLNGAKKTGGAPALGAAVTPDPARRADAETDGLLPEARMVSHERPAIPVALTPAPGQAPAAPTGFAPQAAPTAGAGQTAPADEFDPVIFNSGRPHP